MLYMLPLFLQQGVIVLFSRVEPERPRRECVTPTVWYRENGNQPQYNGDGSSKTYPTTEPTSGRRSGGGTEASAGMAKSLQGGRTGSKRVALAFYGLTRSLKFTIDSIKVNVMDQLTQAGYEYDVYLHTYDLKSLNNIRSGETGDLNTTEWKLLSPDYVQIDDQVGLCTPALIKNSPVQ